MAIFLTPSLAFASTVDELQAQINALLAQLAQLQGQSQVESNTSACGVTVSVPLREGDYSTDVINLQKILNSDTFTQVSSYGAGSVGNETMYFGPATKTAVMRFQQKYAKEVLYPLGIFDPTGVVGNATIAKLNSVCKAGGNTNTVSGNTTTGNSQTTTSNNTSNNELNGTAGYLTVTKYNTDVENTITNGGSENVVSFKAKAEGSDIRLTNIRLELEKYNSTGSTYPNRYFRTFEVYADDKRVGTLDVDDFNRDSSGHYSTTIRLDNAKIRMGSSNQVIFKIKAISADFIDSDNEGGSWTLALSNMRYVDATGANLVSSDTITSQSFAVEKLSSSGDVKIKISSGSSNPEDKTVFVSDTSSGDKVIMNEFKIKAEGTKISFDTMQVRYEVSGITSSLSDKVTELQLVRDDNVIATADPYSSRDNNTSSKVITFNIDEQEKISDGSYATYKIVAKMKKIGTSSFAVGDSITISVESASSLKVVNAEDRAGDLIQIGRFSGSSTGKPQIFRSTGMNISKTYTNAEAISSGNSSRGYGRFTAEVRLTASGNEIWIPLTSELLTSDKTNSNVSGVLFQMENGADSRLVAGDMNSAPSSIVSRVSGGTTDSGYVRISDGESAVIRLQVSYDPKYSGFAKMQVVGLNYKSNRSDSTVSYIEATPVSDFETNAIDIRP